MEILLCVLLEKFIRHDKNHFESENMSRTTPHVRETSHITNYTQNTSRHFYYIKDHVILGL